MTASAVGLRIRAAPTSTVKTLLNPVLADLMFIVMYTLIQKPKAIPM